MFKMEMLYKGKSQDRTDEDDEDAGLLSAFSLIILALIIVAKRDSRRLGTHLLISFILLRQLSLQPVELSPGQG